MSQPTPTHCYTCRSETGSGYRAYVLPCPLHAAAPALLEALKAVTRTLEAVSYTTQFGPSQKARLDQARAAIAQARGEQP